MKLPKTKTTHIPLMYQKHIIKALGWEAGDELKMEVARDFDMNPTTLVVMRREKEKK